MNDKVEAAAREIAVNLFDGETQIEASLANIANLISAMHPLKAAAGLTVFHAQDVLEQAAELIGILTTARRKAGALHRKLDVAQTQIGIKPIAFGPIGKPYEDLSLSVQEVRQLA